MEELMNEQQLDKKFYEFIRSVDEENSEEFTDFLYGLVWRHRRVDLLDIALKSNNEEVVAGALFVMEECASLSEMVQIKDTILALASRTISDQLALAMFLKDSAFFSDEIPELISEILDSHVLGLRRRIIEYLARLTVEQFSEIGKKVFSDDAYNVFDHQDFDDGKPTRNRIIRAFRIGLMIALGFDDERISNNIELEDSYSLETKYRLHKPQITQEERSAILEAVNFA